MWNPNTLKSERRKDKATSAKIAEEPKAVAEKSIEFRTEFEKDYDRLLFSTPVRRLADKTQVFPLDPNDSVRTRLTHSHEVANLAKSIGQALISKGVFVGGKDREIIPILSAIGLAHDLGNPPFGHQGENSIQAWFKERKVLEVPELDSSKNDFLLFDGNAQTFRLITKLQILNNEFGLNLTYETLAALLKYTVPSDQRNDKKASTKKHGFFKSEESIAKEVLEEVGLTFGGRHPLTFIMEACDDIAYSIMDVEDSVKKGLVSFSDVIADLQHAADGDSVIEKVSESAQKDHRKYRSEPSVTPSELNDISMQMFRVHSIAAMVLAVVETFEINKDAIFKQEFTDSLIKKSSAAKLCKQLKHFAFVRAYKHPTVTELELKGHNTLHDLMDMLWAGIVNRKDGEPLDSERTDPFSEFSFSCISENYKRVFLNKTNTMPTRYKEAQLLTDMISGMTDSYAIKLHQKLRGLLHPNGYTSYDPVNRTIVSKKTQEQK